MKNQTFVKSIAIALMVANVALLFLAIFSIGSGEVMLVAGALLLNTLVLLHLGSQSPKVPIIDRGIYIKRANQEFFNGLLAGLDALGGAPYIVVGSDGIIKQVSDQLLTTFDVKQKNLRGKPLSVLSQEIDLHVVEMFELAFNQDKTEAEILKVEVNGKILIFSISIASNPRTGDSWVTIVDVSASKHLEDEKSGSYSLFAASVAHDLNNLIGSITGSVDILTRSAGEALSERQKKLLHSIGQTTERSAVLTKELLDFGVSSHIQETLKSVALSEALDITLETLWSVVGQPEAFSIVNRTPAGLKVLATETGVDKILRNLLYNSIDAMPDGGTIAISAGQEGEDMVWIHITDSGTGMSEEVMKNIFQPFYSTKKLARKKSTLGGSGLGLANVKNLITSWGGSISVESVVGEGSTFKLLLKCPEEQTDEAVLH